MKTAPLFLSICALFLQSCTDHFGEGKAIMNAQGLDRELNELRGKRIYFGHQSVGGNILDGVRDLLAATKNTSLHLVDVGDGAVPAGPYFAESRIGKNTQPDSKCDAFRLMVGQLAKDSLEIALMKFCYVDFNGETDVRAMFARYASTVDSLEKTYPGITFVHVTAPLTVRTPGWKKFLKRVLGREEVSDIENAKRNEFNDLMRAQYGAERTFDLAAVESTYPDGARRSFTHEGKTVYCLIDEYSDDGTHLNARGRDLAAQALIRVLAVAAGKHS